MKHWNWFDSCKVILENDNISELIDIILQIKWLLIYTIKEESILLNTQKLSMKIKLI